MANERRSTTSAKEQSPGAQKPVQGLDPDMAAARARLAAKPAKTIKAWTTVKVDGAWQLVELVLNEQFDLLEVVKSQPDMRAIITETFRIKVGKYWAEMEK